MAWALGASETVSRCRGCGAIFGGHAGIVPAPRDSLPVRPRPRLDRQHSTPRPAGAASATRSASASSADSAESDRPATIAFAYRRVPVRAWRLLTTKPSPFVSVRARAKLWLPPVSSKGLNRTSPIRWTARRTSASSTAERADSSSSSRATARTLSRWASRTASRLRPSAPRVIPSNRRRRRDWRRDCTTTMTRRIRTATTRPTTIAPKYGATKAFRSIGRSSGRRRTGSLGGQPSLAGATLREPRGDRSRGRCYPPRVPRSIPPEASRSTWRSVPEPAAGRANDGPCSGRRHDPPRPGRHARKAP